jgi:hypothetical protein
MFEPSQEEGTRDLLPIGIYSAQIIDAAVTVPQSLNGYGIDLTWQITEGEYENRLVWHRITFQHSNDQAQKIGRREFKNLCAACGITKGFDNVDLLKFISCKIKIGIEKDKNGIYDDRNRITRVWPINQGPPVSQRPASPPPKSPAAPMADAMAAAAARFAASSRATPPQNPSSQNSSQTAPNGGTPPQNPSSQTTPPQNSQSAPPQSAPGSGTPPWRDE